MTGGGEFDDDRDRCEGGGPDDDSWHAGSAPGVDWMAVTMALADNPVPAEALDLAVPLDGRWPEPRLLDQAEVFYLEDRTEILIDVLDGPLAARLIDLLHTTAPMWHHAACRDDDLTTPSGVRRVLAAAGVPPLRDLDPDDWIESTDLVRTLRRIEAAG